MEDHLTRAADVEQAVLAMTLALMGQASQDSGIPLGTDPETIAKYRRAFAMPILMGIVLAAAKFAWVTAPTDGRAGDLLATLERAVEVASAKAVSGDMPAGEFWITAAAALAQEG